MEATIAVGTVPGFAPFTMHKQESTTMFKLGSIFRLSPIACDYHVTIKIDNNNIIMKQAFIHDLNNKVYTNLLKLNCY